MKKKNNKTNKTKAKAKAISKEERIKISATKGRPFLFWVGKRPIEYARGFPAQLIETFHPDDKIQQIKNPKFEDLKKNWRNLLFHGDNKEVIGLLLANGFRGKIDVIYIDPPFDSGANYIRKVELRGKAENKVEFEGEDYTLWEQIQYHDIWINDSYLQFMYERLLLMKELLSENGSIFINVDEHKSHFLRLLMDEVFGSTNFVNEIIWYYPDKFQGNVKGLANNHQSIYWYAKSEDYTANKIRIKLDKPVKRDKRVWSKEAQRLVAAKDESGKTIYEVFSEKKLDDVWVDNDIWTIGQTSVSKSYSKEYTGYPTQKPEELLRRIIKLASKPGDLLLDCFVGSGPSLTAAQNEGVKWIGIDINKGAIQTSSKRIQEIIKNQHKEIKENGTQAKLTGEKEADRCRAFDVFKVNDYDLQLLRSEAIELAIQHIGIQRTRTDSFFDGTFGKNLVKIIDFNHPLTILDIQLIQEELKKRPDENRNITIVCLGKEVQVDAMIDDYNKKHSLNKFDVIELRTDSKYGKFLIHKPPTAKLDIKKKENKIVIEIKDFISPTIIERLSNSNSLFKVKITDFRSMIDVVLIDTNYDGKVFNIVHSDVPQTKKDLVVGKYELDLPKGSDTVAIKIIDMLGEELLITKKI